MSKSAFRASLAFLVALLLFALSPFAFLGGLLVVVVLFIPFSFVLAALGVDVSGSTIDELTAIAFISATAALIFLALSLLYGAWRSSRVGEKAIARRSTALACTLMVLPIVIYLFFKALPGI